MSEVIETTARRERTRQRLLDAAAQVFAEVGLDAASVETVCERAGFTRGAFYSNFDSKDELFLDLARRTSNAKLELLSERVRGLETAPGVVLRPAELLSSLLDIEHDDRLSVLLFSEIRARALRDPAMAAAFMAWDDAMTARVTQLVADIARVSGWELRMAPSEIARQFLITWETASQRAVMAGLDHDALCAAVNERMRELADAIVG